MELLGEENTVFKLNYKTIVYVTSIFSKLGEDSERSWKLCIMHIKSYSKVCCVMTKNMYVLCV